MSNLPDTAFPPDDEMPAEDLPVEELSTEEEQFSLDDLSAAYARAMAESGLLPEAHADADGESAMGGDRAETEPSSESQRQIDAGHRSAESEELEAGASPLMIVEAALFVGRPDSQPLTAAQIAATMRGVSAADVEELVDQLNAQYRAEGSAFEVHRRDGGMMLGIRDEMRSVRAAFYVKVRETRLNQASVDVLALVAYQPGITTNKISEQRGKDSGPIVNQLVRRELLEMRRESRSGEKPVPCFYPTARLLNLLGLQSLEDLPMVDE